MSKIGVVIPWRKEESRLKPLEYVLDWYATNLSSATVYYADKPGMWQHSGSRNLGVKMAEEDGCDVIICNDADTVPEIRPLLIAIEAAKNDMLIHNPYTICNYLDKDATNRIFDGERLGQSYEGYFVPNWVCGGVLVFQPQAWWLLGGMDEKIYTGAEDAMFARVHDVIHGRQIARHAGNIYCFWHERTEKETGEDWAREAYNNGIYYVYGEVTDPKLLVDFVKFRP